MTQKGKHKKAKLELHKGAIILATKQKSMKVCIVKNDIDTVCTE
jgi:hypothetical protein